MLNTLKITFAVVSALLAGRFLISDDAIAPAAPTAETPITLAGFDLDTALQQRVNVDINGTFADVVKWLRTTGLSFTIADNDLSSRKISVKLENQPLKDAMDSIAEAMGGKWVKKGEIYTFSRGNLFTAPDDFVRIEGVPFGDRAKLEGELKGLRSLDGKAFPPMTFKGEAMTPQDKAKFEKEMKAFSDGFPKMLFKGDAMSPKDKAKFEKEMKSMQDTMKGFVFDGKEFKELKGLSGLEKLKELKGIEGKLFDLKSGDGFAKVWVDGKEISPEKLKGMKLDGKNLEMKFLHGDMKGLDEKTRKQIEEAMKASEKALDMHFKGMTEKERASLKERLKSADDKFMFLDKSKQAEVKAKMLDAEKHLKDAEPLLLKAKSFNFENADIKNLIKSVSPAQKELHKKQGFLKFSDLTAEQRKMLPNMGTGDWSLHFSIDGQSIAIKKG